MISMWAMYNGETLITQMDVAPTISLYNTHINARMNGNRTPFGIFNHFAWFNSNSGVLNTWIASMLQDERGKF